MILSHPKTPTNPNQQTGEWFQARIGHLTASRMKDVLAVLKNGQPAKARMDYAIQLVAERMTDLIVPNHINAAMQHGIDTEPYALAAYEEHTGNKVIQCGFLPHGSIEYFGASPDGLVGNDGLVETKCPTTTTHIAWMLAGEVPEEHKPQMLAQLSCTGREWCDFVSFDNRIKNEERQLFIRRFQPAKAEIEAIEQAAIQFLKEVDAMFERVTNGR